MRMPFSLFGYYIWFHQSKSLNYCSPYSYMQTVSFCVTHWWSRNRDSSCTVQWKQKQKRKRV
jgi:hypothetical protein